MPYLLLPGGELIEIEYLGWASEIENYDFLNFQLEGRQKIYPEYQRMLSLPVVN